MSMAGGSFIGMEVASSLAKKGCDVAVIAMETVPFERVLGKSHGFIVSSVFEPKLIACNRVVAHTRQIGYVSMLGFRDRPACCCVVLHGPLIIAASWIHLPTF